METSAFVLSATPRQIAYARSIAERNRNLLPWDVQQDRRALSAWMDAQTRLKPAVEMIRGRVPSRLHSLRSSH